MAAKVKLQARACCGVLILWCISSICLDFTSGVTTQAATTTAAPTTTTTPATTTTPTTTTVAPTQPPSPIAINTDIGPCTCDLTASACDVTCCCDPDCTADDIAAFSTCLPTSVSVDDRLCVQSELVIIDNTPYTSAYTDDGLFCIYFDNYAERNYYNNPDLVVDTTTFENYLYRFGDTTYQPAPDTKTLYADEYKSGDPVFVVYQNLARGYLGVPKAVGSTFCSDSNPAAFLQDETSECVRDVYTLTTDTCTNTNQWKASSYYSGIRVVTTPYLFNWIVNQTGVTNPATSPVTTATPTTTATDVNATTTGVNNDTTTIATTTSTVAITTDNVTTTIAPTTVTVPSVPVDIYNNSYTVNITVDSVTCEDVSGQALTCPANSPLDPTYSTDVCSNVVLAVEYILTYGADIPGFLTVSQQVVTGAKVKLTLGAINQASLPITQKYSSTFQGSSEVNAVQRSGNPGYLMGKPVRAGVRYTINSTSTTGARLAISESLYDLTLIKSTGSGDCATGTANRLQVNFGEDVRTGCQIRFNYENVTAYCTAIGQQIIDVLEGLDGITYNSNERYVANFGNSDALVTGDWVPIIRTAPRAAQIAISISGPTCSVSTGMHVQVLYANIGALVNPQRKILGVKFTYEDPQSITFKCIGVFCSPGSSALTQTVEISQSVTFIDVSEPATGYVGEVPIFLAKLPYDFFYPFLQSAGRPTVASNTLVSALLCVILFVTKMLS